MSTRPHPLDLVEIRFGIGGGVLVATVLAAGIAGLGEEPAALLLLGVCALLGATVGRGYAVLLGLTAWALLTGFVTHSYGDLTFAPSDLLLVVAFVATALGASSLVQHAAHSSRSPQRAPSSRRTA